MIVVKIRAFLFINSKTKQKQNKKLCKSNVKENVCAIYGEVTVDDRTCEKRFAKICAGDFSLNDNAPVGFDRIRIRPVTREWAGSPPENHSRPTVKMM